MILAEIHCSPLNAPNRGSKQGSNDTVDSVVSFSCDRGYRLQGSARRTCTTLGNWDGVEAKCVGEPFITNVVANLIAYSFNCLIKRLWILVSLRLCWNMYLCVCLYCCVYSHHFKHINNLNGFATIK